MGKNQETDNVIEFKRRGLNMLTKNYRQMNHAPSYSVKENVGILYKRDWKQTDKQGKSVYNVTITGKATISTLELVSDKAGIPAWYLLLPLKPIMLDSHDLEDLVIGYINSTPETQQAVLHLLKTLTSK